MYFVEHTEESTIVYRVRPFCWCFMLAFFYLSEVFELTFIPWVYRKLFHKGDKPTLIQWLGRYPRLWSTKKLYPVGTEFKIQKTRVTPGLIGGLFGHL